MFSFTVDVVPADSPGGITARYACNGPGPVSAGRASFHQAIVVGRAGAGLPTEWTNPGQCTPSPAARRFTSHIPLEDTNTSLPVSPRPTKKTITDGSLLIQLSFLVLELSCMISTGQWACAAQAALTEPSNRPANPPWPRLPSTSM